MKSITQLFKESFLESKRRGYKNFYVAIDAHGTIACPTKSTRVKNSGPTGWMEEVVATPPSHKYYKDSLKCLRALSLIPGVKIILWTSAKVDAINDLVEDLESNFGIKIAYVNSNPDFPGNAYADFSKKFCFDMLIDDKAGFDPENDWKELLDFIQYTDWTKVYEDNGIVQEIV